MFSVAQKNSRLDLSFSASLENIDRAAQSAKEFLIAEGLDRWSFDILLGLREALNNSVVKGCGTNRKKTVSCQIERRSDRILLRVEDEGEGFDWRRRMGNTPEPLAESGRGIAIFERYFETVWFNEKGNKLALVKLL